MAASVVYQGAWQGQTYQGAWQNAVVSAGISMPLVMSMMDHFNGGTFILILILLSEAWASLEAVI